MDTLVSTVRQLLLDKGFTQEEFTNGIGMSQSWCSRFLSGEIKDPRRKTVENIARFFNVTYEYLVTGKEAEIDGHISSSMATMLIGRIKEIDAQGGISLQLYVLLNNALDMVVNSSLLLTQPSDVESSEKTQRNAGHDKT